MNTRYATQKATVLVVDDTPANLSLISELLKDAYHVKVATTGMRALEIARSPNKPDLILLDILMPDIDGYAVCRELKRNSDTEGIPIIFLTARADPADEEHGLMLGAVDYITKPISPPVALARIGTQLQLQSYAERLQMLVTYHASELEHTRSRFALLLEASLALAYESDYLAMLAIGLQTGRDILNCDAGNYFACSPRNTLELTASTRTAEAQPAEIALYDGDGNPNFLDPCAHSLHQNATMVIDNVTQESRFDTAGIRHLDNAVNYRTVSMLVVPVIARNNATAGVLCFHNAKGIQPGPFVPFDNRDIAYVESLAAQIAAALSKFGH